MAIDVQASRNVWRTARRCARVVTLAALSMLTLAALLPSTGVAQDSPASTATPHWITAPSLPVRGPRVLSTPMPPGAMVPTFGSVPQHPIRIGIDGSAFMMHRSPCVASVAIAIRAHDDLFTGDPACDALIRQARAIQRQKEAEDPDYANEPRITPAPTSAVSGDDKSQH